MIRLKNDADVARIAEAGEILSDTLRELRRLVADGITTGELDAFARAHIEKRGARPSFLGYMKYPASLCVAVNEEVIHGIPGKRRLRKGDIIGLDLGVNLRGYFADAAVTLPVGSVTRRNRLLLSVTQECLRRGIEQAVAGNRVSDISRAVFECAAGHSLGVVREYCGHGVGFAPHEDPQVPNYAGGGPNPRLKEGMVLAIEPMINAGGDDIELLPDGWTVVTADGAASAHYEHTLVIRRDRAEILTRWDRVDAEER